MSNLPPPENENYAATVVRVQNIVPLENCDNVVGVPFFGYQAVTGKDIQPGELRILFTAETQLSEEYARLNNLHRHGNLNDDESAKGYLEDNRRIKAIKFRGHRSSALLMPLESVAYTGVTLDEGDTFDKLGSHEICRKYVVKQRGGLSAAGTKQPKVTRVEEKFFPQHNDTSNYFRNSHLVEDSWVTITQKLHGTSIRVGNVPVARKLNLRERLAKKLGVKVPTTEYDYIYGSRKVIKDPNNPDHQHFYGYDLWTEEGKKLVGLLPKGYIVYGELIGWTEDGSPIQKNYTYTVPKGERQLFVYRVAHVNSDAVVTDLGWEQVKEFCKVTGLRHVPELWQGYLGPATGLAFVTERFIDVQLSTVFRNAEHLSEVNTVDEGVCIRKEGLIPTILKAKSPIFLEHETKMLDKEVVDLEADA